MESKTEKLLHKYWETTSSLEEEKELKLLLKQEESAEYDEVKELFGHFDTERSHELDESFDLELLAAIEAKEDVKVLNFSDYVKRYSSIAAAILVLFVSSYVFIQQQPSGIDDTFETPEAAYAELKRQLLMVSMYMNKGSETVNQLSNLGKFEEVVNDLGTMERASGLAMNPLKELNITN